MAYSHPGVFTPPSSQPLGEQSPRSSPATSYAHLLETPLSNIWQYSDATYEMWTEEVLDYERGEMMNTEQEPPIKQEEDDPSKYDYEVMGDTDDGLRNMDNVREGVEGLDLGNGRRHKHHHHQQQQNGGQISDQGQTAIETADPGYGGCLGCREHNHGRRDGSLWGLNCGHVFHPDCLRQYLETCWHTCQSRDKNPVFVCPQCGDQLDSVWYQALMGVATFPMG
ncbi:hypothetical protein MKZ38_003007 [Zalerion maritima]|uniref:RING-type domain-containing protein n=1 Tax=Zalerion maritima TaxID=339359 RepID=A0AAD5RPR4_9PEZI|nr:hypothetical protein MKZ38_003007 [Zalerion maritima]